jgi:hypothetical protein
MYNKIMLLLTKSSETETGILEEKMAAEWERVRELLPKGTIHRRAIHLANDPTQQTAHAEEVQGTLPFDAVFEVGAPDTDLEKLMAAIKEIPKRLESFLELGKSAVIAGVEHLIIPGEDSLTIIFAIRRLQEMTPEAFYDHWLNKHAEVGRSIPNLRGYRQFHADAGATIEAARAMGVAVDDFDGVAQSYFKDVEDFLKIMSEPEMVQDAIDDEKNFIDHTRSPMGVYDVTWSGPA